MFLDVLVSNEIIVFAVHVQSTGVFCRKGFLIGGDAAPGAGMLLSPHPEIESIEQEEKGPDGLRCDKWPRKPLCRTQSHGTGPPLQICPGQVGATRC